MTDDVLIIERSARERVSGGYRYNDAVAGELRRRGLGGLLQIDRAQSLRGVRAAALLIDSLWLQSAAPAMDKWVTPADRRFVLGHYFPPDNPLLPKDDRDRWLETARGWLAQCSGVLVTGERARAGWAAHFPAVPLQVAAPAVTARRRRAQPSYGNLRLLTLSSLQPAKLPLAVLAGMAGLHRRDWTWRIAGSLVADPQHLRACREHLATLGLDERVIFVGPLSSAAAQSELNAADIYLAPSMFESFGMASAEALATGLPLLGFDTGDLCCWLPGDDACVLVPVGDVDALVAQLAAWLDRPRGELPQPGRPKLPMTDWRAVTERIVTATATPSSPAPPRRPATRGCADR